MSCKKCLFLAAIVKFFIGTTIGCIQINTTCEELGNNDGYRYPHNCPTGSKVHVDENEEKIAFVTLGSDPSTHEYLHPGMKMDNTSFVKRTCSDLRIKCTVNGGGGARDICQTYQITGCIQINSTCEELGNEDGYRYPHYCPTGSKVHVDENGKKLAILTVGSDLSTHEYLHPDMKMDNTSFVRKHCSDLRIKCTINEGGWVRDICWNYEITGCIQINTTCKELRNNDGYRYPHYCPAGSKVQVDENEEKLGILTLGSDPSTHVFLQPDMKMDNTSFVKRTCSDLRIQCTINEEGRVRDICRTYRNAESKETDDSRGKIIGGILGSLAICIGIAMIAIIVKFRQSILDALRARKKTAFLSLFTPCCPSRSGNSQGISQNGNLSREEASGYELDNDLNIVTEKNAIQPIKGSCDDNERNIALEGVQGPSSHPQTGEIWKNLVSILDETQAKDGGTSVPDEVPYSRDMHRNQRDDPGGKAAGVRMEKMQNGWTRGESGPEDDKKNESVPLLPVKGGANQHSDMTGEAVAPVIGSCSDPDLGSMHSVALDTDVESAHFVKNYELNIPDNNNTINNNTL